MNPFEKILEEEVDAAPEPLTDIEKECLYHGLEVAIAQTTADIEVNQRVRETLRKLKKILK